MRRPVVQWSLLAVVVVAVLVAARFLPVKPSIDAVDGWVSELGAAGPWLFALLYFVAVVLLFPVWILTVAAGSIFGPVVGSLLAWVSATAGAAAAFLISRYAARGTIEARLAQYPKFRAIDAAIGRGGWKIVALLRLSPAVPFNLQNYLYGLTPIRFWPCLLASWVAMLPGVFLYAYVGYLGRAGVQAAAGDSRVGGAQWTLRIVGLLATVAVTVYVARLARDALADTTAEQAVVTGDANRDRHEAPV